MMLVFQRAYLSLYHGMLLPFHRHVHHDFRNFALVSRLKGMKGIRASQLDQGMATFDQDPGGNIPGI
ncbi:MAG: hypothetical protein GYA24_14975 [Candidatus Lokiarchaeota archaeon]|nr:hypothetical protein [Candidatus Lokiarchaeota archaeon]